MKTLKLLVLAGLCLSMTSQAKTSTSSPTNMGAIASGGMPPAPRSVVIMEHLPLGVSADPDLTMVVEEKVGQDLKEGKIAAYFEVDEAVINGKGRRRFCIEYKSFEQKNAANEEFLALLNDNGVRAQLSNQFEIVETSTCKQTNKTK